MLQSAATSIAKVAGWITPAPDAAGVITFRLAEGLRLELLSPDGRTVILSSVVCSLPTDEAEADDVVDRALRYAAKAGRRRSCLSLSPPAASPQGALQESQGEAQEVSTRKLLLHRTLRCADQALPAQEFFPHEAQGFLNDLTWWRQRLGNDVPRTENAASLAALSAHMLGTAAGTMNGMGGLGPYSLTMFPPPYSGGPAR